MSGLIQQPAPSRDTWSRAAGRQRDPSTAWLLPPPSGTPPEALTLVCVPHAGAGPGVYRSLIRGFGPQLAPRLVHLPGRESRIDEPALKDVPAVVQALLPHLAPELPDEFALWGHSMGGFVAFEVARLLEARYGLSARALVVSGCQAPRSPSRKSLPQRRLLDDDDLWQSAAALNGIPPEVSRSPELRSVLLPTLRADFAVFETYRRRPGPVLTCPVHAFGGRDDPEASCADMSQWEQETTGAFTLTELAGGHFFPLDAPQTFAEGLCSALGSGGNEAG